MRRLRLFTVFHGNLDFSALPDADLPLVISRCYWPLLALAEEAKLPLGIEMPARSLRRIADEDPEWVKTFRELQGRGLVEAVGSGWAQAIGPLLPVDVNRANLGLGRDAYRELLDVAPRTWFVNEQTFARGLAPLYCEAGADSLVMEWNNPASRCSELRPLRFRPAWLDAGGGECLGLLWNDCVFFQKLQRVAHGECPVHEWMEALAAVHTRADAQLLCVYGGDLEIFDYRPGFDRPRGAEGGLEMRRLGDCLRQLAEDPRFEFVLPGAAGRGLEPGPPVDLTTASQPIPCKKQPRYNPTRWAVSGRDGFGMNSRCHALRRAQAMGAALAGKSAGRAAQRTLVELWGSDFRTRATQEKVQSFHARMGAAEGLAQAELEARVPPLADGQQLLLVNPWNRPWCGEPVEVELRLPPGRLHEAQIEAEPAEVLVEGGAQLEVSSRHRDGSARAARLVLEPQLAPGQQVGLRLLPGPAPGIESAASTASASSPASPAELPAGHLRTEAAEAAFLEHRGGALAWVRFPGVDPAPLFGTVPHGSFDDIAYTPDFYSGHVVAVTEANRKVTDLARVASARLLDAGPVRTTLEYRSATALGEWSKLYRLYAHRPRIDLVHVLRFNEARLGSLRLGTLTLLPDAFDRRGLRYATANGGDSAEVFELAPGVEIAQQRPVSLSVSASSCLGATQGWVSLGDARRGVAIIANRSQAAAAPMLEFADVDDRFFLRIHHTVAETDETRATFFRGVLRVAFAIVGHANDLDEVREAARGIDRGLAYRTETGVGITRGV